MSYIPMFRKLFDEAKQQILDAKWTEFDLGKTEQDILPLPDLSTQLRLPSHRMAFGLHLPTEGEQELKWRIWAMEFVNNNKERVRDNLHDIQRHLHAELVAWNENNTAERRRLPLEKMFQEWLTSVQNLSLAEFYNLYIGPDTAYQFLAPKFRKLRERYEMAEQPRGTIPVGLSLRQVALLHIYQNKIIIRGQEADKIARDYGHTSGEKLYKLYNTYSQTYNRTGVEGREIKPLIKDIKVVINYLNDQQKRQAETEMETISKKIRDRS